MPRPIPLVVVLLSCGLFACAERSAEPAVLRPVVLRVAADDAEAEAARALLERASPGVVGDAFRRLETQAYAVRVHFRELDADGGVARAWRRTVERQPHAASDGEATLLAEVLAGQGGSLGLLRHVDPIEILFPADPPHLAPGTRDYIHRLLPDRTVDGRRLRGAEAARREGVDEPVRLVRAWVDAETGEPVSLELERASSSMLLTERARVDVTLGPGAEGALLPLDASVDASVQFLAEGRRRFMIDMALRGPAKATP